MIAIEDAHYLLFEPKTVVIADRGWEAKENRAGQSEVFMLEGRINIHGGLPRSCWFRTAIFPRTPETYKFQLECDHSPASRQHLTLYRLEVKPFAAHPNNADFGPEELRQRFFEAGESHEHWCLDHVLEAEGRIRSGGVYLARPLAVELDDYASGLRYVCDKLNIENHGDIPPPKLQGSLF